MPRPVLLLGVVVLLAGCSGTPDVEPPEPTDAPVTHIDVLTLDYPDVTSLCADADLLVEATVGALAASGEETDQGHALVHDVELDWVFHGQPVRPVQLVWWAWPDGADVDPEPEELPLGRRVVLFLEYVAPLEDVPGVHRAYRPVGGDRGVFVAQGRHSATRAVDGLTVAYDRLAGDPCA